MTTNRYCPCGCEGVRCTEAGLMPKSRTVGFMWNNDPDSVSIFAHPTEILDLFSIDTELVKP